MPPARARLRAWLRLARGSSTTSTSRRSRRGASGTSAWAGTRSCRSATTPEKDTAGWSFYRVDDDRLRQIPLPRKLRAGDARAGVVAGTIPTHPLERPPQSTRTLTCTAPRIVIPIVAGIGNALMAVPMVRQLKSAWPTARITILARTGPMAEVFRRLAEVEEAIVTGKGVAGVCEDDPRGTRAPARRVSRAVSVQPVAVFAAGGDERGDSGGCCTATRSATGGRCIFFRARACRRCGEFTMSSRTCSLLAPLGIEAAEKAEGPVFVVTDDDRSVRRRC